MTNELFEKGLQVRREVLGAEYVDASIAQADDFSRPLQELVTQYCWGAVWTRPGLDRKTRSKKDIMEVFLQTAIYCGVPAAVDSFRVAKEFFKEVEAQQSDDEKS